MVLVGGEGGVYREGGGRGVGEGEDGGGGPSEYRIMGYEGKMLLVIIDFVLCLCTVLACKDTSIIVVLWPRAGRDYRGSIRTRSDVATTIYTFHIQTEVGKPIYTSIARKLLIQTQYLCDVTKLYIISISIHFY